MTEPAALALPTDPMPPTSGDADPGQTASLPPHDVTDLGLADEGVRRIEWAEREMPVLRLIRERFTRERPLEGLRIARLPPRDDRDGQPHAHARGRRGRGRALRVEPALHQGRRRGGARGPLRHQHVRHARRGPRHVLRASQRRRRHASAHHDGRRLRPRVAAPPGASATSAARVLAGTEETTTGVIRLRAMAADGALAFPVVAVNEALTKHLFDNRYGTGPVHGRRHPACDEHPARGSPLRRRRLRLGRPRHRQSRFDGMGARVAIVEVDPVRAIEALMDGHQVMTAADAARWGEVFVTATGNLNVFREEHFRVMPDGAVLANSGHFDAELDLGGAARARRGPHPRGPQGRPGVRPRREEALPAGRGPARQPRRRRGPSGRGHGHELRRPGALGRVRREEPRELDERPSTSCPADIDARSRASSSRRSASSSTSMTEEQQRYVELLAAGHLDGSRSRPAGRYRGQRCWSWRLCLCAWPVSAAHRLRHRRHERR